MNTQTQYAEAKKCDFCNSTKKTYQDNGTLSAEEVFAYTRHLALTHRLPKFKIDR